LKVYGSELDRLSELLGVVTRGVGVELAWVSEGLVSRSVGHEVIVLVEKLGLIVDEAHRILHHLDGGTSWKGRVALAGLLALRRHGLQVVDLTVRLGYLQQSSLLRRQRSQELSRRYRGVVLAVADRGGLLLLIVLHI